MPAVSRRHSPQRSIYRFRSFRCLMPSFRRVEEICCLTVLGETPRWAAISWLVQPRAASMEAAEELCARYAEEVRRTDQRE